MRSRDSFLRQSKFSHGKCFLNQEKEVQIEQIKTGDLKKVVKIIQPSRKDG